MGRLIRLLTFISVAISPTLGLAGEISFQLPLYYWSMASCSSPGKVTSARCRWQPDDRGGVGISCDVQAREATLSRQISLDIDISIAGERTGERTEGLRRFSYDYAGIGCWAYVPSGMDNLVCRVRGDGFTCNWCNGPYCYEGQARLSQKAVRNTADDDLALAAPSGRPPMDRD